MLRFKGRLDKSGLTEGAKRPVLLLNTEHFTHLKIERTHTQRFYSVVSQTLSQIKNKGVLSSVPTHGFSSNLAYK